MSQAKMSADEMERLGRKPLASFSNDETTSLWVEADRARRSEEEKDATIKALADALESVRNSGVKLPAVPALYVDAALRLVGRGP